MFTLLIFLASLAFPLWLTTSGLSSRRVAIACLIASGYAFGLATAFGSIDIGPHIECPGWFLGGVLTTFLMLSCGLCLAGRRLFFRQANRAIPNERPFKRINRFLPLLIGLSGLLIVVIGILIGPGVPYQDPSPVMRALEARQEQRSNGVAIAGLCIFTSGALWGATRWFVRRHSISNKT